MIFDKSQIEIEIDFTSRENQGVIDYQSFTVPQGNNISSTNFSDPHVGENPFVLGASPMGGGSVFWDTNKSLGYFMGLGLSNNLGEHGSNNTVIFQGQNITMFQIRFNADFGRWATSLSVNGVVYSNDSSVFDWHGAPTNQVTIIILQVSTPLYPIEITSISIGIVKRFDKSDLRQGDALVVGSRKAADNTQPSFGVNSNYGTVPLIDKGGYLKGLARTRIIKPSSEFPIKIFFDGNLIGDFISESWDIRYESQNITITLKDELMLWDDIYFGGSHIISTNTYESFFDDLNDSSPKTINISNELRLELRSISCPDGFIAPGSLADSWRKFCEAAQVNIVKRIDGEIWCI